MGKKHLRGQRSVQEKERAKWLEGIEQLGILKTHCPHTQVIGVSDREGDVYDVFLARRPAGVDWLVRASWNRRVAHPDRYLWETVLALPVIGETQLQVPARENRQARTARLVVRCMTVRLRPPQNRRREKLPEIEVFAIHALETNVDEGAEPLEWLLLTSVPTYPRARPSSVWHGMHVDGQLNRGIVCLKAAVALKPANLAMSNNSYAPPRCSP
ncbi:hypothetical protein [Paraburkholderia youngii]|uniref:hypothetical protein n=1 Tax=Paraburkholderia youngii TaxID=2782701 RepID=UPI003D22E2E4